MLKCFCLLKSTLNILTFLSTSPADETDLTFLYLLHGIFEVEAEIEGMICLNMPSNRSTPKLCGCEEDFEPTPASLGSTFVFFRRPLVACPNVVRSVDAGFLDAKKAAMARALDFRGR